MPFSYDVIYVSTKIDNVFNVLSIGFYYKITLFESYTKKAILRHYNEIPPHLPPIILDIIFYL